VRDDPIDGIEEAKPSAKKNPLFNLFSQARYPHPYAMFHDKPGKADGRGPDRHGFINAKTAAQPKPEGEKRVFLFGNSAVRTGGFEKSISARLEDFFAANGRKDVRVYNMGIASAVNGQFLMYLMQQGIDLEPDLVITYDGYVDLAIPLTYDPRPGYTYNHYMLELIHEYLGQGRLQELDIVRAESERRNELREACAWRSEEWEEALVAAYLRALRKIHELAGFYGFKAYSCLQPVLAGKREKVGSEAKFKSGTSAYTRILKVFENTRVARAALESRFSPDSSRFGDLSRIFADDATERFADMAHVHLDAHIPIAERLYREIEGMV
jgi:hypothetical protein